MRVDTYRDRRRVWTGTPWEAANGYSRAVRVGDRILVTGTVGVEPGGSFAPDVAGQTRRALRIILDAVESLGGQAEDVVRNRIYLTDIADLAAAGAVHGEVFGDIRPCLTGLAVAALVDPACKVEIESEAVVSPA
ncbi:MAG: RidA family protein [Planctomycetota bacterium]